MQHRDMDTMQAMPRHWHASPDADASNEAPPATRIDYWHRLTHAAVIMAWRRDPDVMSDLVATLLDIHLRRSSGRAELTLDELHLMIALELQQVSGDPD